MKNVSAEEIARLGTVPVGGLLTQQELNAIRKRVASGQVNFSSSQVRDLLDHIAALTANKPVSPPRTPANVVHLATSSRTWSDMDEAERRAHRQRWRDAYTARDPMP